MKLACFIFLLLATVFRMVAKFSTKTDETDEAKIVAAGIGIILGFFLHVVAIWFLSGYTLN